MTQQIRIVQYFDLTATAVPTAIKIILLAITAHLAG